jgi:hypothetical protein
MLNGVTVVTAWYRIRSKFRHETYKGWMQKFFRLPLNLVVFTDHESESDIPLSSVGHVRIIKKEIPAFFVSKWDAYWEYCAKIDVELQNGTGHSQE